MENVPIILKKLSKNEIACFRALVTLFEDVFEVENKEEVSEAYLKNLLKKTGFHVFVALYNDKVIGGITGYEIPLYYAEQTEFFIYDVGISNAFQRKGIGQK